MNDTREGRPVCLVTAPLNTQLATELEAAFDVRFHGPNAADGPLASAGLDEDLAAATLLVVELDEVDEDTLHAAPRLELVIDCRAAPVNVDLEACTRHGIPVATTPGRNADCTADLAFTLLLETVRKTSAAETWMRGGGWVPSAGHYAYETFRGMTLKGHTLGIVGGGAVGSRMVSRGRGFGMDVVVYDPFLPPDAFADQARMVPLEELMSTSDIISVHVPENPATLRTVTREHLALMKPSAYFVMAGRWATVDGEALIGMLRDGRIAGAGFDVYDVEPLPLDSELFSLSNVVMTPHIAGASDGVIDEQTRMVVAAARAWSEGSEPRAVVNRRELAEAGRH